jgi:hypothetical protein
MPCRETKADHIFLRVTVGFTQLLDSNAQGAEKLSLINHPLYLENSKRDDHAQISWDRIVLPVDRLYFGLPVEIRCLSV